MCGCCWLLFQTSATPVYSCFPVLVQVVHPSKSGLRCLVIFHTSYRWAFLFVLHRCSCINNAVSCICDIADVFTQAVVAAQVPAGATASASGKAVSGRASLKVSCGPSTSRSYSTAAPRSTFHHTPARTLAFPRAMQKARLSTSAAAKASSSGHAARLAFL